MRELSKSANCQRLGISRREMESYRNATSCLNKALLSFNPLARILIAGTAVGRSGGEARSLRANIAL